MSAAAALIAPTLEAVVVLSIRFSQRVVFYTLTTFMYSIDVPCIVFC